MTKATLAGLTVLALLAGATCVKGDAADTPAPDFAVKDLQGKPITLADYKGKVLIINFWATWCPPCRQEIPGFIESYRELKEKGLEILGLSVDNIGIPMLSDWITKAGINYPVALATREIVRDYEPGDYIPATIVIDRSGRIRYRHTGVMDKATLLRLFQEYSD
jgi:peroxiredoxin